MIIPHQTHLISGTVLRMRMRILLLFYVITKKTLKMKREKETRKQLTKLVG